MPSQHGLDDGQEVPRLGPGRVRPVVGVPQARLAAQGGPGGRGRDPVAAWRAAGKGLPAALRARRSVQGRRRVPGARCCGSCGGPPNSRFRGDRGRHPRHLDGPSASAGARRAPRPDRPSARLRRRQRLGERPGTIAAVGGARGPLPAERRLRAALNRGVKDKQCRRRRLPQRRRGGRPGLRRGIAEARSAPGRRWSRPPRAPRRLIDSAGVHVDRSLIAYDSCMAALRGPRARRPAARAERRRGRLQRRAFSDRRLRRGLLRLSRGCRAGLRMSAAGMRCAPPIAPWHASPLRNARLGRRAEEPADGGSRGYLLPSTPPSSAASIACEGR